MKIIGLSGPSCSGKSTLARHSRLVLPDAAILYEDDFYLPESELPLDNENKPMWDCPESFDLIKLRHTLLDLKSANESPDQHTRENNNNVAPPMSSPTQIEELRAKYAHIDEPIIMLDGIVLYDEIVNINDILDLKILVPFKYDEIKERREARGAYATQEGNWVDPPHFFENVVWPEFLKYCGYSYVHEGSTYNRLSPQGEKVGLSMISLSDDMPMSIEEVLTKLQEISR